MAKIDGAGLRFLELSSDALAYCLLSDALPRGMLSFIGLGWVMERAVTALFRLLLSLALGILVFGYMCRDRVGELVFASALNQRRGLTCSQPEVSVAASLNSVRLSPLRCRVSEGPVRAFETGVTHLRLRRLRVRSARLESATIDYRERDVSHVRATRSPLDQKAADARLRQKLLAAMLDASEMYSVDAPNVSVKTLTASRGGRVQFVMHGFRKSLDGTWNRSQAERVECPAHDGVELRGLDMRVVPGWGKLSAVLTAGVPSGAARATLWIEGRRLDGVRPSVVAELGPVARPTNKLM